MLYGRHRRLSRTDLWAWEDSVQRLQGASEPGHRHPIAFARLVEALRDPSTYPDAPGAVEVRETHISWVFLAGDRAYKLKKPVVFPFLDYGDAERRRRMCEREVELNRRLAGDLYVGVRALALRDGRLRLASPGADAIEHVVEMRRFDEADTLDAAIGAGRAGADDVVAVGRRLARFHATATPRRGATDTVAAVKRVADGNFEALLADGEAVEPRRVLDAQRFVDAFLAGRGATLQARAAAGLVREGHGDLRAEHVLLGDEVRIVDCAEFDVTLREIDVGADLAFLVMDLARLGRPDLGSALVSAYRREGGDPGGDELIAFHGAIRAFTRAKVALLRSHEPQAPPAWLAEVRALFALGERLSWEARRPLALIVCGAPATGKSRLSAELSRRCGLPVVCSDATRKALAGVAPTETAPPHAYTSDFGARTYADLARRAEETLEHAGGVIVDATFGRAIDRSSFASAFSADVAPIVFECRAPGAVLQARARAREREPERVSDAGPSVVARLRESFEPLEEDVPATRHFGLRTDQPVPAVADDLVALLDRHLARAAPTSPDGAAS